MCYARTTGHTLSTTNSYRYITQVLTPFLKRVYLRENVCSFFRRAVHQSTTQKKSVHFWWVFLVNEHYLGVYSPLLREIWNCVTDCYLWGMLQGGLYSNNHRNKDDTKNILDIVSLITPVELRRAINSVFVTCRCDGCLRSEENNIQCPF